MPPKWVRFLCYVFFSRSAAQRAQKRGAPATARYVVADGLQPPWSTAPAHQLRPALFTLGRRHWGSNGLCAVCAAAAPGATDADRTATADAGPRAFFRAKSARERC